MSRLYWDKENERLYEVGVSKGVAYPYMNGRYQPGEVWNGLTAVNENPSGGESSKVYADNSVYIRLTSAEDYAFTIEAYNIPHGIKPCIGKTEISDGVTIGQQTPKFFGFSYRTEIGNDTSGSEYSYEIHIVFKCLAVPASLPHETVNSDSDVSTKSLDVNTIPIQVDANTKTAIIDVSALNLQKSGLMNVLHALEDFLYGTETTDPTMPTVKKILDLFQTHKHLCDSSDGMILDNTGHPIRTSVYE